MRWRFLRSMQLFRSRMRWKRRVEMVNLETGLPKLRALEASLCAMR